MHTCILPGKAVPEMTYHRVGRDVKPYSPTHYLVRCWIRSMVVSNILGSTVRHGVHPRSTECTVYCKTLCTSYYCRYNNLRQGGSVFVGFCLFVCLWVHAITRKVVDGSFWNLEGMLGMAQTTSDSFLRVMRQESWILITLKFSLPLR